MSKRRPFVKAIFGIVLAFALVAAACGDDDEPVATTAPPVGAQAPMATDAPLIPLTLRLGRFPGGAGAAFVTQFMINEDLVHEAGFEFGYDLDVEWLNMANAIATAQALVSGELDIGPMGSAAYISLVVEEQPVTGIAVAEGNYKFVISVRGDSDIRNPQDMVGRKIGTIFGTGLVDAFGAMIEPIFGTADPEEAGMEMINVAGVAALAQVAEGLDAAIATVPAWLAARQELGVSAIYNSYGFTEDHYEGPLGSGAGILIPEAENSVFWPDGFVSHRAITVASDDIMEKHPGAVSAYLLATHRAIGELQGRTPANVASLSSADWGLDPQVASQLVTNEMLLRRGWAWLTEGEADVMTLQGVLLLAAGALASEAKWEAMAANLAKGGDVAKAAYDAAGGFPSADVFVEEGIDKRGLPTWESDGWTAP